MNVELSNGLDHFFQWDKGQKVKIPDGVPTVHFKWGNDAVSFDVVDGWVEIAPELTQKPGNIYLWTYKEDHTMDAARIPVESRPKPADYIYTPTEIKTWESLDERIKALEKGGEIAGVTSVNGKSGTVTLNADDVGAVSTVNGKTGAVTLNADDIGAVSTVNGARGAVKTAFYATATQSGGKVSVSPTPKKIYDAYAAGHSVYCQADYTIMDGLTLTLPLVLAFNYASTYMLAFSTVGALSEISAPMTPVVEFDGEAWHMWITEGVKSNGKLPNPNELVVPLNGVKYAYDGATRMVLPEINTKSLAVTGASVGQTVKISAVDDSGVPTAWEPVDMASGGGGSKKEPALIYTQTLDAAGAVVVDWDANAEGYDRYVFRFAIPKAAVGYPINSRWHFARYKNTDVWSGFISENYGRVAQIDVYPHGDIAIAEISAADTATATPVINGTPRTAWTAWRRPIMTRGDDVLFKAEVELPAGTIIEVYGE